MRVIPISKAQASSICGSITQTTKMPCKSYSLPTESCITGFNMAKIAGSICADCYADKGNYKMYANTIKPAQFARLDSVWQGMNDDESRMAWITGMVSMIAGDQYFRWHDSGDLQGLAHLEMIADVATLTPNCRHWLPTREYGIVKQYMDKHGSLPANLTVRLSAMYIDKPVQVPASLRNVRGITASAVHSKGASPSAHPCNAPNQNGECRDCRACWSDLPVSYLVH